MKNFGILLPPSIEFSTLKIGFFWSAAISTSYAKAYKLARESRNYRRNHQKIKDPSIIYFTEKIPSPSSYRIEIDIEQETKKAITIMGIICARDHETWAVCVEGRKTVGA